MNNSPLIPFDPNVVTKMVSVGRLDTLIRDTSRNANSMCWLNYDLELFDAELFLLFGSLALTDKDNRSCLLIPETSSERSKNQLMRMAERNYKDVFAGEEATDAQKQMAYDSINLASEKFKVLGFEELSRGIDLYLTKQKYEPVLPMAAFAARMNTKHL